MTAAVRKSSGAILAVVVVLVLVAATAAFLSRMHGNQRLGKPGVKVVARDVHDELGAVVATNAVYLPEDLAGYRSTNIPISRVELDWLPKDTTFGKVFYQATNGFRAQVSAVLMGSDRTSIHKPEYCLVGQGLRIDHKEFTTIPIRGPVSYDLPVVKMITTGEIKQPDGSKFQYRALYVYWFVADGQLSADHNKRMLEMARELVMTGVLQRWAYVSCFAECQPGQEEQLYAEMEQLIAAAVPHFQLATGNPLRMARER